MKYSDVKFEINGDEVELIHKKKVVDSIPVREIVKEWLKLKKNEEFIELDEDLF